ncbi:MAG: hypothetical protein A2W00_02115 [Candidatus Eisenbacteria bacterium RBG_16_71_46]|nr:MAG: hypothetical protein A2W00_02115 [Candidatus Eisenbacteria bacterium RBG_16_71_46]
MKLHPLAKTSIVLVVLLALTAIAGSPPAVSPAKADSPVNWEVTLLPSNENPPSGSELNGGGSFRATKSGVFTFQISIDNPGGETVIASHLHRGAAGTNGPVVVTLLSGASDSRERIVIAGRGSPSPALDPEQLAREIAENPSLFYINVHTTAHPGGAARGQLGS